MDAAQNRNSIRIPRDKDKDKDCTWKKPHSLQAQWSFPISSSATMSFLISMVGIWIDSSAKTSSDWSSGRRYRLGISPELLEARAWTFSTGRKNPDCVLISSPTICCLHRVSHYCILYIIHMFCFIFFENDALPKADVLLARYRKNQKIRAPKNQGSFKTLTLDWRAFIQNCWKKLWI